MKNNQKLKGKDLINIGIYAALYCVLMTCISMLGYIPIMMPMLTVIVPIILGVPMMLFYTKVKKFGMLFSVQYSMRCFSPQHARPRPAACCIFLAPCTDSTAF